MRHLNIWHKAAAAVVLIGLGGAAQAAFVGTYDGNDCRDDGTIFSGNGAGCILLSTASDLIPQDTPLIAKFGFENGVFSLDEIGNDYVGLIDGTEFALTAEADGRSGTWSYSPDVGDPFLSAYLTKAGNSFSLFTWDNGGASSTWETCAANSTDCDEPGQGLSHISFFNNGSVPQAPVPAPLALIGAGVLGLTMVRRRRAKA